MYAMALKNPTNLDLLYEIRDVRNIAVETHKLAKKTNGRVTKLEMWKSNTEEVAKDRLSRKRSPQDWLKQMFVFLTTIATIILFLVNYVIGDKS